jgi:hypothetical protein
LSISPGAEAGAPLLGKDYKRKRIELGIIRRVREIKTPADLMTLRLFHPLNGVSLVAVGAAAFTLKTGNFSDAAFIKKFTECGERFKQISAELSRGGLIAYPKPAYLEGRRVPAVDASDVVEKGAERGNLPPALCDRPPYHDRRHVHHYQRGDR